MKVKLNTVGDALALIERTSEVYIGFVEDDPNKDGNVFSGKANDVPYWITCLPLDFFGNGSRVFYSLMCDAGEVSPVGILCKKPGGSEI